MKKIFIFLSLLVLLPVWGVEAAPLDLYPSEGDLLSQIFMFPQAKAFLLTVIILGIMAEVKSAGAGIAGGIALTAAVALFSMQFITGEGSWLEILLFIGGIGLLMIEVFIPGFGLFGLAGIISILASFYFVLGGNATALNWLAVSIVMAIAIFSLLIKYLPHNPAWKIFVLQEKQENAEGYRSTDDLSGYIGRTGTALTLLRPAGIVVLDDTTRLDVITAGEFIVAGTKVKIVKTEGSRIIVEAWQEN
ncbi:MAG TPA: hypothetical protein IAB06_00280 [Candidatus Avacidaminococcus intestinavium]|uniref:Nodulation efficiency protein D n=1 Tax=Candidatus Avacidaminococcus intestinavium TaxID=2840684 RepID=A0A9D1MNN6_9FIRM|nr:hypothetical protein [Candidatus Avacidaminococcus intestinavium]